jgi:hypothetical protein
MSDPRPQMDGQDWSHLQHVKAGGHPTYPTAPEVKLTPNAHPTVIVNEVHLGEAGNVMAMPDADLTLGVPLRVAREVIGGGWEGFITDPLTGQRLPASLAQWRGRDQNTTLIQIEISAEGACPVGDPLQPKAEHRDH